jgi:hypothetical protein
MEGVEEAKRFLDIIMPRSIVRISRNTTGCLNAYKLAKEVCRICDRFPHFYTEEESRRLRAYKRRVTVGSTILTKIIRDEDVSLLQVESVKKLLNDLHGVFWSMCLAEKYRAGDDE